MCKVTMLRELVKLKLHVAVEEIFELFEKTIAEYEEEFRRSKEARKRRRDEEPDAVLKPRARLRRGVWPASEGTEEEAERGEPPAKKNMMEGRMTLRASQRKTTQANGGPCEDPRPPPDYLAPISDTEGLASDSDNSPDIRRAKQTTKKKSKCRECGKTFALKEDLEKHAKTHSGKKPLNSAAVAQPSQAVGSFTCSVCEKSFPSRDGLESHLGTHAEEKAAPCASSGQQVTTRAAGGQRDQSAPNLDNVTSTSDRERDGKGPSRKKKSKCSRCDQTFARKRDLKRHARTHARNQPSNAAKASDGVESFTCSLCTKTFPSGDLLIPHMRTHQEEKPAASGSSRQGAGSKSKKLRSLPDKSAAVAKPSDEYFACSFCPRTFTTRDLLTSHEKTHTEEKPVAKASAGVQTFSCSVCVENFSSRELLISHVQAQHTKEEPVAASGIAPQHGATEDKNVHSQPDKSAPVTKPNLAEKYFTCSFCPKIFTTRDFLNSHKRTHTELKPPASAGSSRRSAPESQKLQSPPNKSAAAAAKPSEADDYFDCLVCSKSFTTLDFLTSHLQTHAGEKRSPRPGPPSDAKKLHSRPDKLPAATDKDVQTSDSSDSDDGVKKSLDEKCSENGEMFVRKAYVDGGRTGTQTGKKALNGAGVTKLLVTVKSLNCSVCTKTFVSKELLVAHMRGHGGEKAPPSARPSGRVVTTEEKKGDRGGGGQSRPAGLLAPLSDSDLTSDSSEDEPDDDGVSATTTQKS
ncbi:zinc finger protein 84-like isoform X2 [Hippocampus zosterae]|uniref:zinc finger protein 84-like isoform X2 n=1 Tax=Hippocampus zosterae TaxID=109293 RepID=UPI00223CBDC9|nr:zinc finger protein 84-like isoform X2 [Hippocampus zosterae]